MPTDFLPSFRRPLVPISALLALALLPSALSAHVSVGAWEVAVQTLALAELTAAGVPDLSRAQERQLSPASASGGAVASAAPVAPAPSASAPVASAPSAATPSGTPAPSARSLGVTAMDQQLVQLLTANAWCYMRYSQQMGSTTTERVVFSTDGRVSSGTGRETAVNNQFGSYYGNSNSGEQDFWRVETGALLLSADGRVYEATPLSVTRNSNGAPIITSGGKEYSRCQ